ncbi:hypothetical protein ACO2Q0_11625 [Phenylobacterium sp. VNQ135]|uniref:hypothetical protein n=1 Tax=Phenylobacterium sp. VNQ135 TaxID=3400922 RepID=UPI003C06E0C3
MELGLARNITVDHLLTLKPGSRWQSSVCSTNVVVVRPPNGPVSLECGGSPMRLYTEAEHVAPNAAVSCEHAAGSQVGKRYYDEETGIEVLCVKSGSGSLSLGDRPLLLKEAKKLPSSD